MPAVRAAWGPRGEYAWPASSIVPSSGECAPLRTFMSVLLPAPFSPMRARAWPARSSSETPRSASVAPKRLEIADMRSRGPGEGTAIRLAIGEDRPDVRILDGDRDLKILGVRRVGNVGCITLTTVGGWRATAQNSPPGFCAVAYYHP